jgi:hypothetical protein
VDVFSPRATGELAHRVGEMTVQHKTLAQAKVAAELAVHAGNRCGDELYAWEAVQ